MKGLTVWGCIAGLVASSAAATVLLPLDLAELSAAAHTVIYGQVVESAPEWAGDRRIETRVTVVVLARFKGDPGKEVDVMVPGGELGGYRGSVAGTPSFAVGEEAVFFLRRDRGGLLRLVGLQQGVLRVSVTGQGRRVFAPIVEPLSPGVLRTQFVLRAPMALEDFGRRLASVIAETRTEVRR